MNFHSFRITYRVHTLLFPRRSSFASLRTSLGSSSIAMTQAGTSFYSRQTYFPYGAPRTTEGSALPTDYTFTGQKSDDSTELMFYNARYYDTTLGRFTQPDTIVPNPLNPQSLNRFAYVLNNPLKYTDPTGHVECWDEDCDGGTHDYGDDGGSGGGKGGDADLDGDGVADDQQEGMLPADTGEEQGPDKDEPGKCDVASANGSFRANCTETTNQEQQEAAEGNPGHFFMGVEFNYTLSIWFDKFWYGGYDLIWIPDTHEFALYHFGYASKSGYQEGVASPQASLGFLGMVGKDLPSAADYEGRADSASGSGMGIMLADTQSKSNPNIMTLEFGYGPGFPPIGFSLVTTDWDMIGYLKEGR